MFCISNHYLKKANTFEYVRMQQRKRFYRFHFRDNRHFFLQQKNSSNNFVNQLTFGFTEDSFLKAC